jgi:hypothetical protein
VKIEKKIGEIRGDIEAIRHVLTTSFRKTPIITPPKHRQLSQERRLKILLLSRGFGTVIS